MSASPRVQLTDAVADAVARAREHLVARQAPEGWWRGELRTNVTMDAEDLLLRQFLGILEADELEQAARWIRSQQRDDGTWATFFGGPGDLSTTIEAYAALRLAGDGTDAPHMARARAFVLERGGIEASRVFTRIWLALFGEWDWDDLPAMPPEVIFLPSWVPSTSTTGPAGPARRSCRSRSSRPCGHGARCRSRSPSCAPASLRHRPKRA